MQNSLISIIIPVYNSKDYALRAINSLLNQTYSNVEILSIDSSTDETFELLEEIAKKDSRLKHISQPKNGPGAARHVGINNAKGEYIMFCDSDDYYEPNMCEVMLKTIKERNVDMVMCQAKCSVDCDCCQKRIDAISYHTKLARLGRIELNTRTIFEVNFLLWNKIFKKEILNKYNINFTTDYLAEDVLFDLEYLTVSREIYGIEDELYNYTIREDSIMHNIYINTISERIFDCVLIFNLYYEFLKKNNLEKEFEDLFFIQLIRCFGITRKQITSESEKDKAVEILFDVLNKTNYKFNKYAILKTIKKSNFKNLQEKMKNARLFSFLDTHYEANTEKLKQTLKYLFPQNVAQINGFFDNPKIKENISKIEKNKRKVKRNLILKAKTKPLKVAFLCNEASKWKCQTLFDLIQKDSHFDPFVLITKMIRKKQEDYQAINAYNFFKEKNIKTKYVYDIDERTYTHAKDFDADIIFYQQPWHNAQNQGPVVASEYALTYYVPYFVATSESWIEYDLDFHMYVHKHYVFDEILRKDFASKMKNKGKNLVAVGNPQLDYFYLNKKENKESKYVIFAPHHSIDTPHTNWATFWWSADFMLNYAKKHPEINWIFKPHPNLRHMLITTKTMNETEIDAYWASWAKVGQVHEVGDYLDLFEQSSLMITDSGSFLTEYFYTSQPVIHLRRADSVPFNSSVKKIIENYYQAYNQKELEKYLDMILVDKKDPMKERRLKALDSDNFKLQYAAKNILDDIKKELEIND